MPDMWGAVLMMEEFLFLSGCPHCDDGVPAIVTMWFTDPNPLIKYGKLEGVDREKFIAAHQSHRSAQIMSCKRLEDD